MRALEELSPSVANGLSGVVFDLDDTVLDRGALTEAAFGALFRMREVGLRLVACTGRPAGWGEVVQRQWPIDAAVCENGAIAFRGDPARDERVAIALDPLPRAARMARRARLVDLAERLVARFPSSSLADDNHARVTDVTLDIGEHRRASAAEVAEMRRVARAEGVSTHLSSIHLHLTYEPDDKASGVLRLLGELFGEDATAARLRYAFVGDSGNDAAAFAAFRVTFGVANVRRHLGALTVPPAYVAGESMGLGFARIAQRLVALREGAGARPSATGRDGA
jgi:HAD superfamily hydrolase (TIGR01484 family)